MQFQSYGTFTFYRKNTKNTRIDFEAKDNAGRTQIVLLVNEKPVE